MNLIFQDPNFGKECNDSKKLQRHYGPQQAKRIRQRLDELRAANSLDEMRMLPGRCHALKGDRAGQLSLDLVHPQRLVFEPADVPPALKPDGGIDWKQVRTVRLLGIEDTHE